MAFNAYEGVNTHLGQTGAGREYISGDPNDPRNWRGPKRWTGSGWQTTNDSQGWAGAAGQHLTGAQAGLTSAQTDADSLGYAQSQMGSGQVAQQIAAGGVGRGGNPLGARNAMLRGGQTSAGVQGQAAGTRAQEVAAARGGVLSSMGQQATGELDFAGMDLQRQIAQSQYNREHQKMKLDEDERQRQFYMQMWSSALGSAGSGLGAAGAAGAFSDERVKEPVAAVRIRSQSAVGPIVISRRGF